MFKVFAFIIFISFSTRTCFAQNTFSDKNKNLDKGIVLFSKENCKRCEQTKTYFVKNNIAFKEIDIRSTKNGNNLMWQYISKKDANLQTVKLPTLLINGKINYNIKDLTSFLKKLL